MGLIGYDDDDDDDDDEVFWISVAFYGMFFFVYGLALWVLPLCDTFGCYALGCLDMSIYFMKMMIPLRIFILQRDIKARKVSSSSCKGTRSIIEF